MKNALAEAAAASRAPGDEAAAEPEGATQTVRAQLRLRELIVGGQLKPGERIAELAMVERLGMSRTPIRAALMRLQEEGLLEALTSGGFVVRAFSEADIHDAIELRGTLEGLAARFAAERGVGTALLAQAHECLEEIDALLAAPKLSDAAFSAYVRHNARFHALLAEMGGSALLQRQIERVVTLPFASPNGFVLLHTSGPRARDRLVIAHDQHRALLDAIQRGDGARAESVAREHARNAQRNLGDALHSRDGIQRLAGGGLIRRRPGGPALSAGPWIGAQVVALRDLSPTVREITLRAEGGMASAWSPGSHLRVQVVHADGRPDERRYSLVSTSPQAARDEASWPRGEGGVWRIAVKRAEPSRGGSAFMWRLAVGDMLPVQPPHNHFELPLHVPHTLLVAGGIGITPIVGMAMALVRRKRDLRLCYAARSDEELVYATELRAALGERLVTFADASGERLDLDAEIAALPPQGQMLICGPVPMLHAAREAWQRAKRAPQRLRFETFGNTGARAAESFRVSIPRHGIEFEVPADRSLLEMLDMQRVQVLRECLRGECGLCAVDVSAVQGEVDHRDVFFSAAEKRSSHKLCACVSRVCALPGAPAGSGRLVIDSFYRPDTLPPITEET